MIIRGQCSRKLLQRTHTQNRTQYGTFQICLVWTKAKCTIGSVTKEIEQERGKFIDQHNVQCKLNDLVHVTFAVGFG